MAIKCISFNKDGDSKVFYRDYSFLMDRHHVALVPTDEILAKYLYFSIIPYFRKMKFGWGENVADVPTVSKHSIAIPKDLSIEYSSFKIQEAIVEFLEFWKNDYTNIVRERVSKKKPIYEAIKKIVVQNTFKNDKFLVEKFNQFSKDKGYNLKFSDIKFMGIDIFNDEENIELIGSKKIGLHDELEKINDKDGIPVYDASANILTYVEKKKYLDAVFTVINNDNPDISFASEGNSSAGTNFIIHQDSYFSNNHRTVIKFLDKYYGKYIYYNIYKMKEKYGFKRGYIPSQKELKRLKVMILIPKTLSNEYNSFIIQNIFVEFWEMIIGQIDEKLAIYHRMLELTDIIDRAFLYRTFSKIDWSQK